MENVILVGCELPFMEDETFYYSMEELKALTETAEGDPVLTLTQKRDRPDPATYIGKGKVEEISDAIAIHEADTVIFNDELSPGQHAALSRQLDAKIIDRTQLILDIFAGRARTKEGKLQVELAQLEYTLPRLSGMGLSLSRLGGGIGTRGPGETQLETDRRHIRRRIHDIKVQLKAIVEHRSRYREQRKSSRIFQIALVGYTNAGKSTLFNQLTTAETFEEDKLFATLDPLTRKFKSESGFQALLTDTVGFIQHLPTTLIAAFRSTLEEVREAELFIHVVDASHPDYKQHEKTVRGLLHDLGAGEIPVLLVYNKKDQVADFRQPVYADTVFISAKNPNDIKKLQSDIEMMIKKQMKAYGVKVEADNGRLLSRLKQETIVSRMAFDESEENYLVEGYADPESPLISRIEHMNGEAETQD